MFIDCVFARRRSYRGRSSGSDGTQDRRGGRGEGRGRRTATQCLQSISSRRTIGSTGVVSAQSRWIKSTILQKGQSIALHVNVGTDDSFGAVLHFQTRSFSPLLALQSLHQETRSLLSRSRHLYRLRQSQILHPLPSLYRNRINLRLRQLGHRAESVHQ